ncbi:lysophospholipid acyltransferase family protein [Prochlorococcus sp. MIT 1341]|uniref:lysophospholipid acyltransferase family protein n=1 Tax=Prochlorococcus sp. MIT 1341 TaxID=3096221 RepID=UPI002A75965D|nr:lysophospholipid acyltransferase family protein [Prochlorococcus sp. MIT 1341]
MASAQTNRETNLCLGVDPFWSPLAMVLTQDLLLRNYFRERIVIGRELLPKTGPVVLAPTHRARWDALMLPMASGRRVTGRDCRFMVTITEMKGLQGWFLKRLGCFPIDQNKPSLKSLRYAIDLMASSHQLVLFPEGHIRRRNEQISLQPGLARLVKMAQSKGVQVPVVPIGIGYSNAIPKLFGKAAICFGEKLQLENSNKESAVYFNKELSRRMHAAEQAALKAVGRI